MALDFAFSEIVRRRGTLRCNVIVLDEILTHLDASGREAVGSILRRMVSSSGDQTSDGTASDLNSAGTYETVLVILQDLAATELEEAFDHIDVVYKEKDISKVIIDGCGRSAD
jgi:DNA repair exonuclease SbcCD ATPase subunit